MYTSSVVLTFTSFYSSCLSCPPSRYFLFYSPSIPSTTFSSCLILVFMSFNSSAYTASFPSLPPSLHSSLYRPFLPPFLPPSLPSIPSSPPSLPPSILDLLLPPHLAHYQLKYKFLLNLHPLLPHTGRVTWLQ